MQRCARAYLSSAPQIHVFQDILRCFVHGGAADSKIFGCTLQFVPRAELLGPWLNTPHGGGLIGQKLFVELRRKSVWRACPCPCCSPPPTYKHNHPPSTTTTQNHSSQVSRVQTTSRDSKRASTRHSTTYYLYSRSSSPIILQSHDDTVQQRCFDHTGVRRVGEHRRVLLWPPEGPLRVHGRRRRDGEGGGDIQVRGARTCLTVGV